MTTPDPTGSTDGAGITRVEAIQLLGCYYSLAAPRWQNLQAFVSVFLTVDLALLGVTVGVMDKFTRFPANLLLLAAPAATFVIGLLAKIAIRRQDRHIRELIVVIGHLEQYLGLDHSPPGLGSRRFWPDDESFLPMSWIANRVATRTSDEFVESRTLGGTAATAARMFTLVQVLAVLIAVAIAVAPLAFV